MRLDLNTEKKTAVLVDGEYSVASIPAVPMSSNGVVINAHFDALFAELRPLLDKYLAIERAAAPEQVAPRTAAMQEAERLEATIARIEREVESLKEQEAKHSERLADAAILADNELAGVVAKIALRKSRIDELRAQRNALVA
jgi:hypothetical protein